MWVFAASDIILLILEISFVRHQMWFMRRGVCAIFQQRQALAWLGHCLCWYCGFCWCCCFCSFLCFKHLAYKHFGSCPFGLRPASFRVLPVQFPHTHTHTYCNALDTFSQRVSRPKTCAKSSNGQAGPLSLPSSRSVCCQAFLWTAAIGLWPAVLIDFTNGILSTALNSFN